MCTWTPDASEAASATLDIRVGPGSQSGERPSGPAPGAAGALSPHASTAEADLASPEQPRSTRAKWLPGIAPTVPAASRGSHRESRGSGGGIGPLGQGSEFPFTRKRSPVRRLAGRARSHGRRPRACALGGRREPQECGDFPIPREFTRETGSLQTGSRTTQS
jgi:hypothetical protein